VPDLDKRIAEYAIEVFMLDEDLIHAFISQVDKDIEGIGNGLEQEDYAVAAACAHNIKGMGGTVDLPEISVLAADLEQALRQQDNNQARLLFGTLKKWRSLVN
jgi:HPt (histidine-containing phosphotransfer) domain-containing protein